MKQMFFGVGTSTGHFVPKLMPSKNIALDDTFPVFSDVFKRLALTGRNKT
jgi:hypothetical protein